MKFLRSRYILILLVTVLVIEGAFRLGFYEPLVSPLSHSGRTIALMNALEDFGTDRVNVIALGDSRAAQGLNNRLISKSSRELGVGHVRMSMPGSHLMTFKTLTNWGVDKLPELQGIVLVISPASFNSLQPGAYELSKILPLRNQISLREILKHVPFDRTDIRTYAAFSSIAGYREDFKNLLADPGSRRKALVTSKASDPKKFLNFSNPNKGDLCAVTFDDSNSCKIQLKEKRGKIPAKTWNALNTLCKANGRTARESAPGEYEELVFQEWMGFFNKLSRQVKLMLVILPDHSIYQEKLLGPNANWLSYKLLDELRSNKSVDVLDLRNLIVEQQKAECSYYMDVKHLNKAGNDVLTQAMLPALKNFWEKLEN